MNGHSRHALAGAAALLLTSGLAGCSSVLDSSIDLPDEAEVTVTGSSPVPLTLITSSRLIAVRDEENQWDITLNEADTLHAATLPVTQRHPLNETGVFFVRLRNPSLDETATVRLQVRIDSKLVYDQAATMRDASLEYLYFIR